MMFDLIPFGRSDRRLMNMLDRFGKDFFSDFDIFTPGFVTDIADKGDHYLLEAELPGFAKEDIRIELDGDMLTVSASRSEEKEEKDQDRYIRKERRYGSYARSFSVAGIKKDGISAEYVSGLLKLRLPKDAALTETPKRIDIQ